MWIMEYPSARNGGEKTRIDEGGRKKEEGKEKTRINEEKGRKKKGRKMGLLCLCLGLKGLTQGANLLLLLLHFCFVFPLCSGFLLLSSSSVPTTYSFLSALFSFLLALGGLCFGLNCWVVCVCVCVCEYRERE